jgi:pimeloyl-ACP methyl ester carboxylesterase
MAADKALFGPQLAAFSNLRVQPWIDPRPNESLRSYAARLARFADPGRPCIVGGASFGGVVALEMARHLPALACILIGSLRAPWGLPFRWRLLRPVAQLGPNALRLLASLSMQLGDRVLGPIHLRRLHRISRPEATFLRWAMCALVRWSPSPTLRRVPIYHIHGAADRVLPATLARADVIVPGGGHALSLVNPSAVNEFIASVVRSIAKNQHISGRRPFVSDCSNYLDFFADKAPAPSGRWFGG